MPLLPAQLRRACAGREPRRRERRGRASRTSTPRIVEARLTDEPASEVERVRAGPPIRIDVLIEARAASSRRRSSCSRSIERRRASWSSASRASSRTSGPHRCRRAGAAGRARSRTRSCPGATRSTAGSARDGDAGDLAAAGPAAARLRGLRRRRPSDGVVSVDADVEAVASGRGAAVSERDPAADLRRSAARPRSAAGWRRSLRAAVT